MRRINWADMFEETAAKKSQSIAVVHKDENITFCELARKAKKMAAKLIGTANATPNTPVAVFLPKEINSLAANLGILYAGCPFMNLDVQTPAERIKKTMDLVKPCAVFTNKKYAPLLANTGVKVILTEEAENEEISDTILSERRLTLIDSDPFCIINTSGSTGTPKAVALNHDSFFNFLDWSIDVFAFDGTEIFGSLSPIVFDIYVYEICLMMLKGARIVLLDSSLATFPVRLLETVEKNEVSFIFWVPSIMVNIANMDLLKSFSLDKLKMIWFAGEVFPTKQFLYWYDHLSGAKFVNLYGPIETTVDCTYHIIDSRPSENEPLPIGKPCRNTEIIILNDDNRRCAVNEEGEICIRSSWLAMGYYNNPEKTSAAFVQNPLNTSYPEVIYRSGDVGYLDEKGLIQFKGRKDSMIKHTGHRIELGEIEHILINDLRIVKYCCVVYNFNKKEIVLFYESENEITPAEFRKAMKEYLPAYMIPAVYIRMEELPRNTNGKIDRNALKNKVNEEN